jgi:hypothetical protein
MQKAVMGKLGMMLPCRSLLKDGLPGSLTIRHEEHKLGITTVEEILIT